jgi:hypothetical protein
MPWPITFLGERPDGQLPVGSAYWVKPEYVHEKADGTVSACAQVLSRHYDAVRHERRPIALVIPSGYHLIIDAAFWGPNDANPTREGWVVQLGAPPVAGEGLQLTLSPSVNVNSGSPHGYHGFVSGGVVGDDVDGRRFS